jgi:hypothetical protein
MQMLLYFSLLVIKVLTQQWLHLPLPKNLMMPFVKKVLPKQLLQKYDKAALKKPYS